MTLWVRFTTVSCCLANGPPRGDWGKLEQASPLTTRHQNRRIQSITTNTKCFMSEFLKQHYCYSQDAATIKCSSRWRKRDRVSWEAGGDSNGQRGQRAGEGGCAPGGRGPRGSVRQRGTAAWGSWCRLGVPPGQVTLQRLERMRKGDRSGSGQL